MRCQKYDNMYIEFLNTYRQEYSRMLRIIQFWTIEFFVLSVRFVGQNQVKMIRINILALYLIWLMILHVNEYRRYVKKMIKNFKLYSRNKHG